VNRKKAILYGEKLQKKLTTLENNLTPQERDLLSDDPPLVPATLLQELIEKFDIDGVLNEVERVTVIMKKSKSGSDAEFGLFLTTFLHAIQAIRENQRSINDCYFCPQEFIRGFLIGKTYSLICGSPLIDQGLNAVLGRMSGGESDKTDAAFWAMIKDVVGQLKKSHEKGTFPNVWKSLEKYTEDKPFLSEHGIEVYCIDDRLEYYQGNGVPKMLKLDSAKRYLKKIKEENRAVRT